MLRKSSIGKIGPIGVALCLVIAAVATIAGTALQPASAYVVTTTFTLRRPVHGVDGTLQLRSDSRLTASVRKSLWGQGPWSSVLPAGSDVYKAFSTLPPANAQLTIEDTSGKAIAQRDLHAPLATLEAWNPSAGNNRLFLVTEDLTAEAGSYNGPGTTLLEVSEGAWRDVDALNPGTGQRRPIRLAKTLKSDWRIVRRTQGAGQGALSGEILSVSCHPKFGATGDGAFVVTYARYSFDGTRWLAHEREQDGFWEADGPFPSRSSFP